MMSPRLLSDDRGSAQSSSFRHAPFQILHVMGNSTRLWSVYSIYYYLSQTGASHPSTFYLRGASKDSAVSENLTVPALGMTAMVTPILAGILLALRRVIARRLSLKNQFKWIILLKRGNGLVNHSEKPTLHMVFSSPRQLMVAGSCIIILEIFYKTDFYLPGFLICSMVLGFGIYEATSLEHNRKESFHKSDSSNGFLGSSSTLELSSLPT